MAAIGCSVRGWAASEVELHMQSTRAPGVAACGGFTLQRTLQQHRQTVGLPACSCKRSQPTRGSWRLSLVLNRQLWTQAHLPADAVGEIRCNVLGLCEVPRGTANPSGLPSWPRQRDARSHVAKPVPSRCFSTPCPLVPQHASCERGRQRSGCIGPRQQPAGQTPGAVPLARVPT